MATEEVTISISGVGGLKGREELLGVTVTLEVIGRSRIQDILPMRQASRTILENTRGCLQSQPTVAKRLPATDARVWMLKTGRL